MITKEEIAEALNGIKVAIDRARAVRDLNLYDPPDFDWDEPEESSP